MASGFINQLLDLLTNSYGLLGIVICFLIVEQAKLSRRLAWLLFSVFCYATSLAKFKDEWTEGPPLVFPLELLRSMGRPLAIVLLGMLLLVAMQTPNGWRRILIPQPVKYLIMVQVAVMFKILLYGDVGFAFLGMFTFGAVVQTLRLGPARWLQDEQNFYFGVWSLAVVGTIFVFTNSYQAALDMHAITFVHGRFLGTTGNPQHAAALLASILPSLIFLIEKQKKWDWIKVFWIINLLIIGYFLFLTGSRTGSIMALTSILFFYRQRGGALLRIGLIIGVLLVLILPFVNLVDAVAVNISVSNRYLSGENTREQIWSILWRQFINNPIFGTPLQGSRLGFSESVWLATVANLGIIGLIPLLMMALGCLKMMFQLHTLSVRNPVYFLHSSTIIAGLASILSGSFTEALLLGNLSFPVIAVIMYLSLGKYLLDVNDIQKYFLSYQHNQI